MWRLCLSKKSYNTSMTTCTNCNGEGLVGQGDNPALKQGRIDTCSVCNGTGKVGEPDVQPEAPAVPQEPEATPPQDTPVDNSDAQNAPEETPVAPTEPSNLSDGSSDSSGGEQTNQEQAPQAEQILG